MTEFRRVGLESSFGVGREYNSNGAVGNEFGYDRAETGASNGAGAYVRFMISVAGSGCLVRAAYYGNRSWSIEWRWFVNPNADSFQYVGTRIDNSQAGDGECGKQIDLVRVADSQLW